MWRSFSMVQCTEAAFAACSVWTVHVDQLYNRGRTQSKYLVSFNIWSVATGKNYSLKLLQPGKDPLLFFLGGFLGLLSDFFTKAFCLQNCPLEFTWSLTGIQASSSVPVRCMSLPCL